MNRLWVRLSLGFAVVTLLGLALLGILLNQQISTEARSFVGQQQALDSGIVPALEDYYATHHSWDGVASVMQSYMPGSKGNGRGPGGSGEHGMRFVLADVQGQVIYDSSQSYRSSQLTSQDRQDALPIDWQGEHVGWLVAMTPAALSVAGQTFLAQVNQSLLQAGILAAVAGLVLGVVLARGLTIPLRRLASAAQAITRGDLTHQVREKGPQEIRSLARTFNAMEAHLQQAERLRRNLVADIAHELRTPLSVLQGNLRALLDEVYPLEKAEVAVLYDETLTLSRLVTDLHELSLSEAGQLSLQVEATPLEPLLRQEASLFGDLAAARGIVFQIAIPDGVPPALIDPDRTRQIVQNLLTNALRHTPDQGHITLTVDRVSKREIRIQVEDSGSGIAPEDVPHVFERFWRAERSRSRASGGSGLGLAIARALVEQQGGQIGVTSELGKGSCFWFTLPIPLE